MTNTIPYAHFTFSWQNFVLLIRFSRGSLFEHDNAVVWSIDHPLRSQKT